ncbi:MAG: hypothetical protein ACR2G3_07410 [Solirubrobacterales bacterium]
MSDEGGTRLDRIARELAAGEISRRSALKRLAAAGLGLGAAMAPAGVAEAMGGGCPPGRVKCDGKCCPKNARCRNGRCRCKPGFKKCGRKCVNLDTSIKHCGACGNGCPTGRACIAGVCTECSTAADCPTPGSVCQQATCVAGVCGSEPLPAIGQACQCDCGPGNPPQSGVAVCNEGTGLVCQCGSCCTPNCAGKECGDDGCGGSCGSCGSGQVCQSGQCQCAPSCAPGACGMNDGCGGTCLCGAGEVCNPSTQTCVPTGTGCGGEGQPCSSAELGACRASGVIVCDQQGNSICNAVPGQPQTERCNGIDDNCNGLVDDGFPVGEVCECSPGVFGTNRCTPDELGVECVCG